MSTTAPKGGEGARYRRLHAAERVITSDLHLPSMLERVVRSSCKLVDVRYAALAVLDDDDGVSLLVHFGLDDATASYISGLSTGAQLTELLERWPTYAGPTCPSGVPIPAADPSHLVEPVVIGDERFADLYLADPVSGEFTDSDRDLVHALARSVASAIGHAQLYDRAQRSTEWMHASGEIARALLAGADVDMFGEVVSRAVVAAGADYGQIAIPAATDGELQLIATAGLGADYMLGRVFRSNVSDLGRAIAGGKALRAPDVSILLSDAFENRHNLGPVMVAPLLDARGTRGSVIVTRVRGAMPYSEHELGLFATYASQVALAMQFADARADAERFQLLETRHNTAREVHDIVMQRLFATGVGINVLRGQLSDSDQAAVLARYVQDLDDTIDEIRGRIFGLREGELTESPRTTRFPRIELDEVDADRRAEPVRTARSPAAKRGRRRTDWLDGSGDQRR